MAWRRIVRLALAPATLALIGAQGPQSVDLQTEETLAPETLALAPENNTRILLPVRINDSQPFDFIVDTGSQATVVTDELSRALALPIVGQAMVVGVASQAQAPLSRIDRLSFGSVKVTGLEAPILQRRNIGADGMLGLDALSGLRVQLDFEKNEIEIVSNASRRSNAGYEFLFRGERRRNQLLLTKAEVDGIRTIVVLDTGAQSSIGNTALKKAIERKRSGRAVAMDVHGGAMAADTVMAQRLKIGFLSVSPMPIAFADSPSFETLGIADVPALSLGMEQMQAFKRIAIDFTEGRVLFDMREKPFTTGTILRN